MGEIRKGILGGFSGKVGTVIGANWRGKDIMRSLPKKSGRIATEQQELQRAKFALVAHFLTPLADVIRNYYGQGQGLKSRRNLAMSYHITDAITGNFPDLMIDYERVVLTKGDLLGPQDITSTAAADTKINFEWADNSNQGTAKPTDKLLVVVYNPAKDLFEVRENVADRNATMAEVTLPANFTGDTVVCYVSFISEDKKKFANSLFMNEITMM
jgi:hypothetical protein